MADHVDRAEPLLAAARAWPATSAGSGLVEREEVVGRPELGLARTRGEVVGRRGQPTAAATATVSSAAPGSAGATRAGTAAMPTARRPACGTPPLSRTPLRHVAIARHVRAGAGATPGPGPWRSGRPPDRRAGTRPGRPTTPAARRGSRSTPATPRLHAARTSRITPSPLTESSAPVGSSASSSRRSPTTARAIATRWRSPPDSSSGIAPGPVGQTELLERRHRRPAAPSGRGCRRAPAAATRSRPRSARPAG